MEKTINIFGVEMGCMSAKEAMVNAIRFLEDDPIDTIELMTMDMLMAGQDDTGWKEQVAALDLVIPEEAEILEAAGVGFDRVVKTTCFLANMEDFAAFNEVYAQYFVSKPARSCVAVKDLPKGALCEIEAIAEK